MYMSTAQPTSDDQLLVMPVYTLVLRLVVALVALTAPPWCQSCSTDVPHLDPGAGPAYTSISQCFATFPSAHHSTTCTQRHPQPQPAHEHLLFAYQSSIQHKLGQSEHVQGVVGLMG